MQKNIIAIDCGNSSVRVIHGAYNGETVTLRTVSQIENDVVFFNGVYYWDLLGIFRGIRKGLAAAVAEGIHIDSIGIDTWGVDFGLLTKEGDLLGNPMCYRNTMGYDYYTALKDEAKRDLFDRTGILPDKINSIFLLKAIRDRFPRFHRETETVLMISGLINYYLTGRRTNDVSMLSTTQFLNSDTLDVDETILASAGFDHNPFADVVAHGEEIGRLTDELKRALGIDYEVPVISVPAHDTASAILAIPAEEDERFAYVSSGTWGLVGTELAKPVINEAVYRAKLTNEVGAFNAITLLRNNAGMYIFQRLRAEFERETRSRTDWDTFYGLAETVGEPDPILFNVNDVDFFNPECMADAIWRVTADGPRPEGDRAAYGHLIYHALASLAVSYRTVIQSLETISGEKPESFYIIGGGARNERLNAMTDRLIEQKVKTGSFESTSLGNVLAQLAHFTGYGVKELRAIARDSAALS